MAHSKFAGALALSAALALGACGGDSGADADGDGEISMDEMRAEVASAADSMRPEPGKYSVTMSVVKADIPGAPQEMQDMMGAMMNRTFEYCLTQEQADKGFEESLSESQDESCSIEKFDLDNGSIDMAMNCEPAQGGNMRVAMTGDVSPTRTDITVVTNGTLPELGAADMEMNMVQERVGDCDS